jgi:CheY-like chemotaxis protein
VNLSINARDAMPVGGVLEIRLLTANRPHPRPSLVTDAEPADEFIVIEVQDSGHGMDPVVKARIFEPFFTTKEAGAGSGLGLSQVLGIVKQQGGHITIDSWKNRGTTFTIFLLPLPPDQYNSEPAESDPVLRGQGETVLLVEDESTVLEAGRRMLELLGYRVLAAENGREAMAIYLEHRAEIALVLSDLVMPDIGGVDLCNLLKAQDPHIKVVMMSGYPLVEQGDELWAQGVVDWIQKPVSFHDLSQIVSRALSKN